MISLVLLQKRERQRESSESMLMYLRERGKNLAVHPPCITKSTRRMMFQSHDVAAHILTAEMIANVADTTRIPERVQLGLLKDAIHEEELGVTRPADECAEQATSLPSIPRDQIAALQQKDAAVARLMHYLDLGRKPS